MKLLKPLFLFSLSFSLINLSAQVHTKGEKGFSEQRFWELMGTSAIEHIQANYAGAEKIYTEIVAEETKKKDGNNDLYLYHLSNLIYIKNTLLKYPEAAALCEKGISYLKNDSTDTSGYLITFYEILAKDYWNLDEYTLADDAFVKKGALCLKKTGYADTSYAMNMMDRSSLQTYLGRLDKATFFADSAISIFNRYPPSDLTLANVYDAISYIYYNSGDVEAGFEFTGKALDLYEVTNKERYAYCIAHYVKLLMQYYGAADTTFTPADYENMLKYSIGIYDSLNYPKGDYVYNLEALGDAMLMNNDDSGAIATFGQVSEIYAKRFGPASPEYGRILKKKYAAYEFTGMLDSAWQYLQLYGGCNKNYLGKCFDISAEKDKENLMSDLTESDEFVLSFYHNHKEQARDITSLLYDNILFSRNLLLKNSNLLRNAILETNKPDILSNYDAWLKEKNRYRDAEDPSLLDSMEAREKILLQQFPQGKNLLSHAVNWKMVRDHLKPGEAAVEFVSYNLFNNGWTGDHYYLALILTPGIQSPAAVELFEESELTSFFQKHPDESDDGFIKRIYEFPDPSMPERDSLFDGQKLYALVWKPLESYLNGVNTIYLAPSGILNNVAFDAIPVDSNNNRILNRYSIVQLLNTGDILARRPTMDIGSAVLFGGINYNNAVTSTPNPFAVDKKVAAYDIPNDSQRKDAFDSLPGTMEEVDAIHTILSKSDLNTTEISGADATEEYFKGLSRHSPSLIHISTHGFFFSASKDPETDENNYGNTFSTSSNPLLRSGLILAGGNDSWMHGIKDPTREDGILTAYEISNLDLQNTSLVVLSACSTGLGDLQGNEGSFGLQRAFKLAGADKLLISLWDVPDDYTNQFMQVFYKELMKDKNEELALKNTKLKMSKTTRVYNWAAFILVQ